MGFFALPNGSNDDYDIITPSLNLELGQRLTRPEEWHGGRSRLFGKYNIRTDRSDANWLHYGGSLVAFKRLDNRHRMITLGVNTSFIYQEGQVAVPFHELAGNDETNGLIGFKERRVIGESIIASTFEYKWPVWVYMDGVLHYSVGNAFGANLNGFDFGKLRQSVAFGLRQTASFGPYFNFLVGLGSNSFDDGGDFNEVRIVIGAGRAF